MTLVLWSICVGLALLVFNALLGWPLQLLTWFHLPTWMGWGTALVLLSWCLVGDE